LLSEILRLALEFRQGCHGAVEFNWGELLHVGEYRGCVAGAIRRLYSLPRPFPTTISIMYARQLLLGLETLMEGK
jgi:hypothetical protein